MRAKRAEDRSPSSCFSASVGHLQRINRINVLRTEMRFRLAIAAVASASPVVAQQRAMTNADYARAERFMSYNTAPLVAGGAVRPTWLPADRFVYRTSTSDSSGDVMIVDAVRGTRARLLDDANLRGD